MKKFAILFSMLCGLIGHSGPTHAIMALTADGISQGFGLTTFADQFPTTGFCCGPLGIGFTPSGGVMVANYTGSVVVFSSGADGQHYSSATPASTNYGTFSPVGIAQVGGKYYLARQNIGEVDEVSVTGAYIRTVVTGIPSATGMVGNPFTGKIYVSDCCSGSGIWEVDPATNTKVQKIVGSFDGLTLNLAGTILYAEIGGTIRGYDTQSFAEVYNSGGIPGGPDGVAIGTGSLANFLFINSNDGSFWEQNILTHQLFLIGSGGSRGDFVQVAPDGTLLITQTDLILRLTAPQGGGFEGGGGNVPEPGTLLLTSLAIVGFGALRRRKIQ